MANRFRRLELIHKYSIRANANTKTVDLFMAEVLSTDRSLGSVLDEGVEISVAFSSPSRGGTGTAPRVRVGTLRGHVIHNYAK